MPKINVVLSHLSDWQAYYPSDDLSAVDTYLIAQKVTDRNRLIINLCRNYKYLSHGYYCSLLAESRGQKVMPSIRTINNLSNKQLYVLDLEEITVAVNQLMKKRQMDDRDRLSIKVFFGYTAEDSLKELARSVFDLYPCPILEVRLKKSGNWLIDSIRPIGINTLSEEEETVFATAIDRFSRGVWRTPKVKKRYDYDMAVLINPDEKLPPSNGKALKQFTKAANEAGLDVDMVTRKDYSRLAEYDALFIRETTAISDHTYRFAQRVEAEGGVVLDDPGSILRCTNKVYLANLLLVNSAPTPKTIVLNRHNPDVVAALADELKFPVVLKIPDGSFSRGIVKVSDAAQLEASAKEFFAGSALIIAQEFYPTDYDWRIGVLNNQPLFACQYFMSRGHWQIYKHGKDGQVSSGSFKTVPVEEVLAAVISTALRATALIGDGLYGVDLKQRGDEAVIVEVNDNPNIDAGVEDVCLGQELYRIIAREFCRRLDINTIR